MCREISVPLNRLSLPIVVSRWLNPAPLTMMRPLGTLGQLLSHGAARCFQSASLYPCGSFIGSKYTLPLPPYLLTMVCHIDQNWERLSTKPSLDDDASQELRMTFMPLLAAMSMAPMY